jgi:hypothetical protein
MSLSNRQLYSRVGPHENIDENKPDRFGIAKHVKKKGLAALYFYAEGGG